MKKFKSTARGASTGYVQNNAHVVCNFIDKQLKFQGRQMSKTRKS